MRHRTPRALLAAWLLVLASGCGRGALGPLLFGLRVATTAAVIAASTPPTRVIVVEHDVPYEAPPGDLVPLSPDYPPAVASDSTPPAFDAVAAHGVVEGVDVSSCWAPGAARGYRSVRVTFNPEGDVGLVEVMTTEVAAPVDPSCVSSKFAAVRVPAFAGAPVVVKGSFFVG
jgi:hypothetical protein